MVWQFSYGNNEEIKAVTKKHFNLQHKWASKMFIYLKKKYLNYLIKNMV